jgi:hypothetical protein
MEILRRNHNTLIPYIIDTEDGPKNGIIDLEKMSEKELTDRIFTIPEAINELVYRERLESLKNTN